MIDDIKEGLEQLKREVKEKLLQPTEENKLDVARRVSNFYLNLLLQNKSQESKENYIEKGGLCNILLHRLSDKLKATIETVNPTSNNPKIHQGTVVNLDFI